jgi:hypothetical protein
VAASADVGLRLCDGDGRVRPDAVARFEVTPCRVPFADMDLAGQDECLRLGPCLREAALHEELVEALRDGRTHRPIVAQRAAPGLNGV